MTDVEAVAPHPLAFDAGGITDPDGNRIELVQWPADHADGIAAADWPDEG